MGQLFTQKYPNNIRTILGLINIPKQDDVTLLCDTTLGAVAIQLLDIPADYWSTQYKLYVIDKSTILNPSGNASVNNITIVAPIGTLINGLPSVVINSNGGGYAIIVTSNTNYGATYCGAGAFGGGGYTTIEDEGVALPPRTIMNFVGASVTATDVGGKTVVTINGGGVTSITNAGYLALVSTNSVVQGQFYLITDALYTDGGVVVQGILPNAPPSVNGVGIHLNADYQGVGNYSSVVGFGTAKGIWSSVITPVVAGDCVVWNNTNYKNLTGNWGTAPNIDLVNWVALPKLSTNGYILECDFVKYSLTLNAIFYRSDARGNEVELYNKGLGQPTTLLDFQWGRNKARFNKIRGTSTLEFTNSNALITYNIIDSGRLQDYTPTIAEFGIISKNIINRDGQIDLNITKGQVVLNQVSNGSISTFGLTRTINVGAQISNNYINVGQISIDDFNGLMFGNEVVRGGFVEITLCGSKFKNNYATDGGKFVIGSMSFDIEFCEASDDNIVTIPLTTALIQYKKIRKGYSNWVTTLDLADPTIFAGDTITIPLTSNFYGIFLTNNGGGLTINKILNMPTNHKNTFSPVATQTATFQHTLVAGAVTGNLLCDAPSSANLITGRTNGSDFIEYETSGDLNIRTNLVLIA
jgi:hypothetical protein